MNNERALPGGGASRFHNNSFDRSFHGGPNKSFRDRTLWTQQHLRATVWSTRLVKTWGKIEAIMLDVTSARIADSVLSFGDFVGMGKKLFALPWGALTLDGVERRFILDASKEELESAEGFDKDHWPSMAEPGWATRLYSYYNVTPYWRPENTRGEIRHSPDSSYATDRAGRPADY
jgi:hypothetical protein